MTEVQPGQLWRNKEGVTILFLQVDLDCKDWPGKPAWRVLWFREGGPQVVWIPIEAPHWPMDPARWTVVEEAK